MGRVAAAVSAGKALVGFVLGFALLVGGLVSLSLGGGDHVSIAVGNGLLFLSAGGKLLSVVLGGVGIAAGTGVVCWAEDSRRAVVRDHDDNDETDRTVPTPGSSRHG